MAQASPAHHDEPVTLDIGALIRSEREKRQWTQMSLARRIGVSLRTEGGWENGNPVPRSRLPAIEKALGVRLRPDGQGGYRAEDARTGPPDIEDTEQVDTDGAEGRVVLYYRPGFLDGLTDDERERIIARGRHAVLEEAARIRRERGE